MTTKDSYFELLCVLAELGQALSPSELSEFREHSQLLRRLPATLSGSLTELHATMVVTNAQNRPLHRTPRGMTGRFIARAIREGVPLNERISTAGVSNLVLASATLLILLIAGTIVGRNRTTPFVALPQQSNTANSSVYNPAMQAKLSERAKQTTPYVARNIDLHQRTIVSQFRSQNLSQQSSNTPSERLMRTDRPELLHQQTTASNNAADQTTQRSDALSAELNFAQAGSFNSSSKYPRFKFFVPREIPGREPNLLTACVCSPLAPLDSHTSFALASSVQFFQPSVDAYRTTVKPEFRLDPATLLLIENVRQ